MNTNKEVSQLTVDDLRNIIVQTIDEAMDEIFEDFEALLSESYKKSIVQARKLLQEGKYITLEEFEKKYADRFE